MQTHSRKFRSCFLFASFQCMQEGFRTLPSGEITGTYGEGYVHSEGKVCSSAETERALYVVCKK